MKVVRLWTNGAWYCGESEALPASHCHSNEWFSSRYRHFGPIESRLWWGSTIDIQHSTWKEQNTVYTVKRWGGAHSILKFANCEPQMKNHLWPGEGKCVKSVQGGNIQNCLCFVISWIIQNLVRGKRNTDVCCLVEFQQGFVCAAKQSTFVGLNSLFHDIATEVDIPFYQLYWLWAYPKAWGMH